jgi:hypothetical protein
MDVAYGGGCGRRDKVFKVNRESKEEYDEVTKYGVSLGIPEYQLDFSPKVE